MERHNGTERKSENENKLNPKCKDIQGTRGIELR